ncbi:threonine synthase [Halobacteriales archaeon SW_5_68_122]|nr:MAG: threonine synthase [Halobacteriales archaeon SW_5_68_122]
MTSFEAFRCADCRTTTNGATATRCPNCGRTLDAAYDLAGTDLDRGTLAGRAGGWKHRELLPFVPDGIGEGATPLVETPRLAEELDVETLHVKDESHNPTGSVTDRGLALVAEAADRADADTLALPTTGDAGQSAAAYAARAGLLSRVFVPSRTNFVNKAMINVHGGDMRVVEGRFDDASESYEAEREELPAANEETWFPAGAFDSPFRHEGVKPVYYEAVEALGWSAPDAVVVPVGHGTVAAGVWKAARELADLGLADSTPRVYAAQPEGCAPIVEAVEAGTDPGLWEVPDTVVGALEIPDPAGGLPAAEAVGASGGAGVAVDDEDALDSAATVAQHEGLEVSVACGVAAAGAWRLRERGELAADDEVLLVNTGAGNKDADIVRSRLMGRGM